MQSPNPSLCSPLTHPCAEPATVSNPLHATLTLLTLTLTLLTLTLLTLTLTLTLLIAARKS